MGSAKLIVVVRVANIDINYQVGGSYVDVVYTEEGVPIDVGTDTADIEVEEETVPIERVITKETVAVIVNMAESSLFNIDKAIPGATLATATISIGDGTIKEMSIKVSGTTPTAGPRTIEIPLSTAVGTVGQADRQNDETVVPCRVEALQGPGCAGARLAT